MTNPQEAGTGSEVVLVVEDEATVRAPIARKLRHEGYFVLEASNGEDAIQVMQDYHSPVHCVVTDVMMPEMKGTELVEMLRSWYPQTRVLFISGLPPHLAGIDYEAIGGAGFLSKPFALTTLAEKVRQLLDTKWGQ
ncbi:MAG: response regulator [Gemmatimonadaceae bacterium]